MNFNLETFKGIIEEIEELAIAHHKELQPFDHLELNIDLEKYLCLDESGMMRMFTMRDEGKIVGYSAFFVTTHLQYKDSTQAVQDLIYLDPSLRGLGHGKDFIVWIEDQLRNEGVDLIFHHTKVKKSFAPLLLDLGYEKIDEVYGKKLI